jgi:hypothetical protein
MQKALIPCNDPATWKMFSFCVILEFYLRTVLEFSLRRSRVLSPYGSRVHSASF